MRLITWKHPIARFGVLPGLCAVSLGLLALAGCSKEETKMADGDKMPGKSDTPSKVETPGDPTNAATGGKKKIVFVFKVSGISYSEACKDGAQQANDDPALNAEVQYQAATEGTAEKQREIVEQAIVGKADAIVISPVDSKAIIPSIKKAQAKGIKVFTWDADSPDSGREFYVAAVDDIDIGVDIADGLVKSLPGQQGKVLLFSGQPTAENLNLHLEGIKKGLAKYPKIKVADPVIYNDDKKDKAKSAALSAIQANPDAVGIACTNSVSPPGAGEALRSLGQIGKVKVWGLGLPSENKPYLKDGSETGLYLWDPQKLTYMTAKLVRDALDGKMPKDGQTTPEGSLKVKGGIVTLPLRLEINKGNVDSFKF